MRATLRRIAVVLICVASAFTCEIALAEPLLATVRTLHKRQATGASKGTDPTFHPHESLERRDDNASFLSDDLEDK